MVLEREEEITRGEKAAGVEREQRKDKSTEGKKGGDRETKRNSN